MVVHMSTSISNGFEILSLLSIQQGIAGALFTLRLWQKTQLLKFVYLSKSAENFTKCK